jgi:hypothetical protein
MRRLLPILLAAILFAPGAPGAPVPKHLAGDRPVYYFPTTVGAKWVYDDTNGDYVVVVTRVEERKGTRVVTVERETGDGRVPEEVMEVSATGFVRTHYPGGVLDPPLEILKVPFKVGDSWPFRLDGCEGTKTISAVETIKVPAGTFEAVRVDTEYTRANQRRLVRSWYAPGIGLLRMTEDGTDLWVLKAFVPGKE